MNIESQLGQINNCLAQQFDFSIGQEPARFNGRKLNLIEPFFIAASPKQDEEQKDAVDDLKKNLTGIDGLFGPYEQPSDVEGSDEKTLNAFVKLGRGSFVTFKIVLFPEIQVAEERFQQILDKSGGLVVGI